MATAVEAAHHIEAGVLARIVVPLAEVFGTTFRLSHQVLLGNAASALNGAATMLRGTARAPVIEPTAVIAQLMARGPLAGTGAYHPGPAFFRDNCCLFYRIPGGGTCADCVLVADGNQGLLRG